MRAELIHTIYTPDGAISFYADDEFIGRALRASGSYSQGEVELWARFLKPGDCVVDVGANIGALTLPLARLVGQTGKVFAFEPQPENFELLKRNVEQLPQVEARPCALGASAGERGIAQLTDLGHHNYGNVALSNDATLQVRVETLDSIVGDAAVALIKVDVQGAEADVLEGARETIGRCRPLLYVENDQPQKSEALLRLIRSFGYRCFHHTPAIAPATCHAQDDKGRFLRDIVSLNLLCVPQEKMQQLAAVTDDLRPAVPPSPRLGKTGWAGIARLGGIGDNLIAASVLRPLKAKGYKIDVITAMPQGVVFENNPFVDKLSIKEPKDIPGGQGWQDWFRSRGNEYDAFANLSHSCEVSLALVPSQTQSQWPSSARRKYYGHSYLEFVHDVVGVPYEFGPLFFPTEEERDQAIVTKRKLGGGPVIGWCLNGSRVDKNYPKAPTTIARLIKELGAQVIMFGAPPPHPDFARAQQTQEYVTHQNGDDKGLHLALSPDGNNPSWPIRRILAQLIQCDLVIGPDTGQLWAVAFEAVPKIMLHSHASVENICKHWLKTTSLHANPETVPCHPCHLLHDQIDSCLDEQRRHGLRPDAEEKGAACISSISVEAIIRAAIAALAKDTK
jgi:FkbM family methyltransferase